MDELFKKLVKKIKQKLQATDLSCIGFLDLLLQYKYTLLILLFKLQQHIIYQNIKNNRVNQKMYFLMVMKFYIVIQNIKWKSENFASQLRQSKLALWAGSLGSMSCLPRNAKLIQFAFCYNENRREWSKNCRISGNMPWCDPNGRIRHPSLWHPRWFGRSSLGRVPLRRLEEPISCIYMEGNEQREKNIKKWYMIL